MDIKGIIVWYERDNRHIYERDYWSSNIYCFGTNVPCRNYYSNTLEDHLYKVLTRLRQVNLNLQPVKCHFFRQTVEFLGYVLTSQGLLPNPNHVTAVQNFPTPGNIIELHQFLGLASHYRRFVAQFAKIASPLH